jgi:hypothetical protein
MRSDKPESTRQIFENYHISETFDILTNPCWIPPPFNNLPL